MNTATIARLIDVSADTVRRWCDTRDYYGAYLSPGATPGDGIEREFNRHDLRVLAYVATERNTSKIPHDQIRGALAAMQSGGYADLPDIPDQWTASPQDGRIAISDASDQAQQLAELTTLQVVNQTLRERLQESQQAAERLQRELDDLRAREGASLAQIHSLELELSNVRGEVSAMQARLSAYAITGGDSPIPVAAIVAASALAAVVILLIALVVFRLVL